MPKSKIGVFLVGAYFCLLLAGLIDYSTSPLANQQELGLMMIGVPWSFILGSVLVSMGVGSIDHTIGFYILILVSWALNAAILYLFGAFLTFLFRKMGTTDSNN